MNQQAKKTKELYSASEGIPEMMEMAKKAMDLRASLVTQLNGNYLVANAGCSIRINDLQSFSQRGLDDRITFVVDGMWFAYFPWTENLIVLESFLTDSHLTPLIRLIIKK